MRLERGLEKITGVDIEHLMGVLRLRYKWAALVANELLGRNLVIMVDSRSEWLRGNRDGRGKMVGFQDVGIVIVVIFVLGCSKAIYILGTDPGHGHQVIAIVMLVQQVGSKDVFHVVVLILIDFEDGLETVRDLHVDEM